MRVAGAKAFGEARDPSLISHVCPAVIVCNSVSLYAEKPTTMGNGGVGTPCP
jgi:hypothetical protein